MKDPFKIWESKIAESTSQSDIVDLQNDYAWELSRVDPQKAFLIANEAHTTSLSIDYQEGAAISLRNLGQCYWLLADYVKSLASCTDAVKRMESLDLPQAKADVVNIIGAVYSQMGDHPKDSRTTRKP